jgi:hypothetical protein
MDEQELVELKELQSKLEDAKDKCLKFLLSKNYKIRIIDCYEDSIVTATHRDYLDGEESYWYRDYVKEDSPEWAEIILFQLKLLLNSYKPYEKNG